MNTQRLKPVMEWIRTTDLVEVGYRDGHDGFELRTAQAAALPSAAFPDRFVPVCASSVGVFQPNEPGRPRLGEEGRTVSSGDVLGVIDTGLGRTHCVKAPCPGRVAKVFVEPGRPVQYGQPLFFLERGGRD
ncbi:MAG: hypothetical protein WC881_00435 [Elusimicrobiota bacterium]|jgi:biotin carboxyl carrier protein